jgi:immune inhibitor A
MVVWYVDDSYTENWTGVHPGDGYLGIVDADQHSVIWDYEHGKRALLLASGKYQMHDAAFSTKAEAQIKIDTNAALGRSPLDDNLKPEPIFNDGTNYLNAQIPPLGRNIPHLGLSIKILSQAQDNSYATILITKK